MDCYACDQEATERCPRCGNPYCRDHGGDPSSGSGQAFCTDCLNPVKAAPSGTVFRVSLLTLLLGSVLALWLLVRPPGLPGESSEIIVPATSPVPVTPSPVPTPATPVAGATAEPTATPTPAPTPTPEGPVEYTVEDGDTLFGIAEFFGVTFEDLLAINGLSEEDAQSIQPGDVLIIPQ